MPNPEGTRYVVCAKPGCTEQFADHKWGQIKAHNDGWFHARAEGRSYCPDHHPEWVAAWRSAKNQSK